MLCMIMKTSQFLHFCVIRVHLITYQIADNIAPRSIEPLGEVIPNLSGQIDLPITLETSHYLFIIIP